MEDLKDDIPESAQQFENIDIKSSPDEYNKENNSDEPEQVIFFLIRIILHIVLLVSKLLVCFVKKLINFQFGKMNNTKTIRNRIKFKHVPSNHVPKTELHSYSCVVVRIVFVLLLT